MLLFKMIGKLFKYTWKAINFIREIVLNFMFLLLLLLILGSWIAIQLNSEKDNNQEGILVLNIEGSVVDSTIYSEDVYKLRNRLAGRDIDLNRENSLFLLTQKIAQATHDEKIKGMILQLDNFAGADIPSLQYIGKYLNAFRQAQKPIYAQGSHYNQSQYYLASFANKIYLSPQGAVSVYGFATHNLYYKTLLENLKVQTHVFRVGTYKSAIEPLIRDDMSTEARQNASRWLNTMWGNYLSDIAKNREYMPNRLVPEAKVMLNRLANVSGNMTEYALDNKLVDSIASNYRFNTEMNGIFAGAPQVSIYNYQLQQPEVDPNNILKPQIAVVFVNGTIVDGITNEINAGSHTLTKQLEQLINRSEVSAVILRVNSPGGSVLASETIRSYIEILRAKKIPVVVSMGGMAASGGYWIASESDYIVASPNTITGSIGIFGVIPTFERSLEHIGVYTDGVSTSPLAGSAVTKEISPEQNALIQMSIENGYQSFINLVAKARELTTEEVDKIAQGQVWLGVEAKKIGLVDQLGDFDDAVNKAAELAELDDYEIDWLQAENDWVNSLFIDFSAALPKSMAEVIYNQLPLAKQLQKITLWDNLTDPQNRYIYCLNCVEIKQ